MHALYSAHAQGAVLERRQLGVLIGDGKSLPPAVPSEVAEAGPKPRVMPN
jgi:hypothetical protein